MDENLEKKRVLHVFFLKKLEMGKIVLDTYFDI